MGDPSPGYCNVVSTPVKRWRLRERPTVERVNRRLKDEFGGCRILIRGHVKMMAHLMFGIGEPSVGRLVRLLH